MRSPSFTFRATGCNIRAITILRPSTPRSPTPPTCGPDAQALRFHQGTRRDQQSRQHRRAGWRTRQSFRGKRPAACRRPRSGRARRQPADRFNATPGTVAPRKRPYGAYAHALAETIRTGGLSLADVFDRTRLRVGELTKGAEISWDADKFKAPFTFFNRAPNAPAADVPAYDAANIRSKPIRDFDERDAYFAALYRDTLAGYEDFLAAYPNDAMARRVRAIVAARARRSPGAKPGWPTPAGLLVIPAALSAWSAYVGRASPPCPSRSRARTAADLHGHRI